MIKSRELADSSSCLNRAGMKEPLFVLRANDESAPAAVRAWVNRYVFDRGGFGALTKHQKAKADEAMALAKQMEEWRLLARSAKPVCGKCGRSLDSVGQHGWHKCSESGKEV